MKRDFKEEIANAKLRLNAPAVTASMVVANVGGAGEGGAGAGDDADAGEEEEKRTQSEREATTSLYISLYENACF